MYEQSQNQTEKDNARNVLISEFSYTKVRHLHNMRPKVHTFVGRCLTGMSHGDIVTLTFRLTETELTTTICSPRGPTNLLDMLISGDQRYNHVWGGL